MPKIITKLLRFDRLDYYQMHLAIINVFLPVKMTEKEIEVLARFMCFEGELGNQRFGVTAKSMVRADMNLSHAGLSNYMGSLMEKGFLTKKIDVIEILPILMPTPDQQEYRFMLVNTETKQEDAGN